MSESLLEVQHHDTLIDQLRHRRATLPERAELAAAADSLAAIEVRVGALDTEIAEVERRQRRLEDEIAGIDAKVAELGNRLYSGTVTAPKELMALQEDIDSLKRHKSVLEDGVIEAMEVREPLDEELAGHDAERARLDERSQALRAAIAEAEVEIDAEVAREQQARAAAAAGLSPALAAHYEDLRGKLGGVAAARLEPGGRCGGCHLTLPAVEVARIKRETGDSVFTCEQCGRILVRVAADAEH